MDQDLVVLIASKKVKERARGRERQREKERERKKERKKERKTQGPKLWWSKGILLAEM